MKAFRSTGAAAVVACAIAACSSSSDHKSNKPRESGYRAEAKLLVTTTGRVAAGDLTALAGRATDPGVLDAVRRDLALDLSADQLAGEISARTEDSRYIVVIVHDATARRAAAIANADALRLIGQIGSLRQDLQARIVQPAAIPTSVAT